jgi:phospholipid/cholesterol/gamma-HCH transport system ATP-binding protein
VAAPTEPTAGAAVIEVEGLVADRGTRRILNGIDLTVREGEILVIMGGSGSGKSTLLRHLLALETPTAGRVRILGVDPHHDDPRRVEELRRRTGVAFQGGALFSSLSVGDNLTLPLRELTRLDPKTMEIMARIKLEVVNLAGFENFMPSELSGGMAKRAALARAIIMDPRILFCDEPSAGLDPAVASALDDLILKLRDAMNMTIVVVTHELASAFKIADRIAVLGGGDLIAVGPPEEIKLNPDPRVQNLIQRRPEVMDADPSRYLERLAGEAPGVAGSLRERA